jgi:phosphoenolpyruvate synthase/pyruvate phosphate dikinase
MFDIRWLGDDGCHDPAEVGGKAASLSRLAARHAVPPGFAITALPAARSAALDGLAAAFEAAYRQLGERCRTGRPAVAVRSSALDEDGADAAFAGQHHTYLNVRGVDALLEAVRNCVLSASADEAMAYRRRRGLSTDDVRMGVLVQQLVPSDVSAVAFSANPISGSRDEVMINANWGLGESIVSGIATPDTFVVRKQGLEVSLRDVATKARMTVMAHTGTQDADVPESLRAAPSLTDAEIAEITRLAIALERDAGHPVDVECAIADRMLYLLQSRPITTLG